MTNALLSIGQDATEFELPDQTQKIHRLKDYRDRWVVLYFYPKDNTPGCTMQACQFRDRATQTDQHNTVVLGVSPDSTASHEKFADKLNLPFALLADTDQTICTTYGVWQQKSMFGRKYMGVVRTTYLIDPNGKIAHRWDKVKVLGHAKAVLAKIDQLAGNPHKESSPSKP